MSGKVSVVTPERFASGFTYQAYIAQIKVNRERFEEYYIKGQLSADDKDFFQKAARVSNGFSKLLVLGEDWCPDVFRGMPVMARIAEAAGIDMRIFPRDKNLDIMNEFLKHGEFMSIPVAVFYTRDLRYICHWIERPELADRERTRIKEEVRKAMTGESEEDVRNALRQRIQSRYPAWQQESVREIRQMLAEKLGI
jgi:thiol-disulfide isomerase/thioredoxin